MANVATNNPNLNGNNFWNIHQNGKSIIRPTVFHSGNKRNVYHVSSKVEICPANYCDCPLHRRQKIEEENQNNLPRLAPTKKTYSSISSWFSARNLDSPTESSSSCSSPVLSSPSLRSTQSMRVTAAAVSARPVLSLEYSRKRLTGSIESCDRSAPVQLQSFSRKGTVYPMRTSVSSSDFLLPEHSCISLPLAETEIEVKLCPIIYLP